MRGLSLHTLIVLLLALLGCTLEADKASAADEDGLKTVTEEHDNSSATVFNTPESCWDAMVSAEANKDIAATLRCLAAEDRLLLLGSLVYRLDSHIARQAPLNEKATALLKRHGLEEVDIKGTLEKLGTSSATEGKTVFKAVGRKIKNQLAFAKEALELLTPVPKPDDQEAPARRVLKLSNVIVSGDTATGAIVADGPLDGRPVYFMREEGSWRVSDNPPPTDSDAKNRAMP